MSKIRCDHCHLEYDEKVLMENNGKYFCCKGCEGIYHLLKDEGLDSFYSKMGENTIEPPKKLNDDIDYRIERYTKCICRSTHNFVTWLKEDYRTKLRLYLRDNFDRDFEAIHGYPPEE